MRENKEISMWTQGYMVWLIIALLTFLIWLVCSFLIYSGLQFFKILSPDFAIVFAPVFSAIGVSLLKQHFLRSILRV